MAKKGSLGCLIGPIASAFRRVDTKVKNAHANWIAILGWPMALITAAVIAWYFTPTGGEPEGSAVEKIADRNADKQPVRSESDIEAGEISDGDGEVQPPSARGPRACDALYALDRKLEFIKLIETEVRRCERYVDTPIELYYSCQVADGVYEVTLKYQVSGTFNDERLPFSAQYRGVRDIDLSTVNVTPLNGAFRNLCRRKAQESREKSG